MTPTPSDAQPVGSLRRTLAGISSPAMRGDNLCIILASFFEPGIDSDEMDDSGTWKQGAVEAADEVLNAIHNHYCDALDAERQKREAAEREAEFWKDHCENVVGKWCATHKTRADTAEASLAKANARIAESDWQPVETLPKDGRSVMVWLAATATERPHAFAPVSVCEDGSWWDDSTGDQIEPFSAVYWKPIQPPNALTNIEKERDDG